MIDCAYRGLHGMSLVGLNAFWWYGADLFICHSTSWCLYTNISFSFKTSAGFLHHFICRLV